MDDHGLLREYVQSRSEAAFGTLVDRHLRMVYSVACRIVHDPHLAEEVAQNAFIMLAQKAHTLGRQQVVAGWLWRTTRHLALHAVRTEHRRRTRELAAVTMPAPDNDGAEERVLARLESAMAQLDPADHEALVLRHLENRSFREVGLELGISEDAARMRVNRALERLREVFEKEGVVISAVVLAGVLAASTATAVPAGLAATIAAASVPAGAAMTATTSAGVASVASWFGVKLAAALICATVFTAAGVYWIHQRHLALQPDLRLKSVATSQYNTPGSRDGAAPATARENGSQLSQPAAVLVADPPIEAQPPHQEADARACLDQAIELLNHKRYEDALPLLNRAIELDPGFADAFFYRGKTFDALEKREAAITNFTRALELKPEISQAWFERSRVREQLHRYEAAIRDCDEALKLNPKFWQAFQGRARAEFFQTNYTSALQDFDRVLELNPDRIEAYGFRARIFTIEGNIDDALTNRQMAAEKDPGNAVVHYEWGHTLWYFGRNDEAVPHFTRAIELDPTYANSWGLRAAANDNLGRWTNAIADYTAYLRLQPQDADGFSDRASCYARLGELDKAVDDLNRAVYLAPRSTDYLINRGQIFSQTGKPDAALADFDKALRLQSNNTVALQDRASAYESLGQFDKALADYSRVITLSPNDPDSWEHRAAAYASQGQWEKAVADCDEAVKRQPEAGRHYYQRCEYQLCLGRTDAALADALRGSACQDLDPEQRIRLDILASGWQRERGNNKEARRLLKDDLPGGFQDWPMPVVRFWLGELTLAEVQKKASQPSEQSQLQAYAGWLDLLNGHIEQGRAHLEWTIAHGDKQLFEHQLARHLLDKLQSQTKPFPEPR
jgi:RNA polymerase sigma factor (sigma-70 family)